MKNESKVIRDWTNETLVVDLVNSLGEKYHFEIPPGAKDNLPTRATSAPSDRGWNKNTSVYVEAHIPIAYQMDMFEVK